MEHQVDAVVCGVGSSGTMTGLSRYFGKVSPATEMILADPVGSVLADYIHTGKYRRGRQLDRGRHRRGLHSADRGFFPGEEGLLVSDEEACTTVRKLLNEEGILAGSSSGTLIGAALRYCREQKSAKRVVTFRLRQRQQIPVEDLQRLLAHRPGLLKREQFGDLRDLITRRHDERATVTIEPEDKLMTAYARMKLYDISQLPVLEHGKVVGIIDEWDLLTAAQQNPARTSAITCARP